MTEACRLTCYQLLNRTFTAPDSKQMLVPVPTSEAQLATTKLDECSQPPRSSFTRLPSSFVDCSPHIRQESSASLETTEEKWVADT